LSSIDSLSHIWNPRTGAGNTLLLLPFFCSEKVEEAIYYQIWMDYRIFYVDCAIWLGSFMHLKYLQEMIPCYKTSFSASSINLLHSCLSAIRKKNILTFSSSTTILRVF